MHIKIIFREIKTNQSGHINILSNKEKLFETKRSPDTIIVEFKKINSEEINYLFEFPVYSELSNDHNEIMAFLDVVSENGKVAIIYGVQYPERTQYEKTLITIDQNCSLDVEYSKCNNEFIDIIKIIEISKTKKKGMKK